jgi:imidazolonepropionase-like amidohydrolase
VTPEDQSLIIDGATLIDGNGAAPVPDAVVLIQGNRIGYAGPRRGLTDHPSARRISASGKTIVPGLIDLHNHSTFDADMRVYLKNGVTSIRFAGLNQEAVVTLRERARRGEVTAPRIFSCGPMLDRTPPAYPKWTTRSTRRPRPWPPLVAS